MNSLIVWLLSWLLFHTSSGVAQLKSRFILARGVSLVNVPHDRVVKGSPVKDKSQVITSHMEGK